MTTVDEARVEAALRAYLGSFYDTMGVVPQERRDMARALAAADAVRGDQQGASPTGPGWSAEPEPVPVSAAGGDHPSRMAPASERVRHVKRGSVYEVLNRTGLLQTSQPLVDGDMLVSYRGADGQWWHRPPHEFEDGRFVPAPAIEARSAETQGGSAAGESAAGEAGAPQLPDETQTLREEVERLRKDRDDMLAVLKLVDAFAIPNETLPRKVCDRVSRLVHSPLPALTPPPTPA